MKLYEILKQILVKCRYHNIYKISIKYLYLWILSSVYKKYKNSCLVI